MWIGDARGDRLGHSASDHKFQKIPGRFPVVGAMAVMSNELGFERLIDDEMDDSLRNSKIGGSDALVEAANPR